MKYALLVVALVVVAAPSRAQQPGPHENEFRACYADFLAAVRANDKEKLAILIAFPADWSVERKGDVQTGTIKDKADFLARYSSLVTSFMRSHIPRAKVQALEDGSICLSSTIGVLSSVLSSMTLQAPAIGCAPTTSAQNKRLLWPPVIMSVWHGGAPVVG